MKSSNTTISTPCAGLSLGPNAAVPVVILMAGQADLPPPVKAVFGKHRLLSFTRQVAEVADGTLVVTTRSGHYIHSSEPELVTWAIRRVLSVQGSTAP